MKKRLIALIVLGLLVGIAVSATAVPEACPYCGATVVGESYLSVSVSDYNAPCSHGKFGGDHFTVSYNVVKTYCKVCERMQSEWWNPGERTETCNGWTLDDYRKN